MNFIPEPESTCLQLCVQVSLQASNAPNDAAATVYFPLEITSMPYEVSCPRYSTLAYRAERAGSE